MRDLTTLDKAYLWHPFTQQSEWERNVIENPLSIARARGVYLYDSRGRKYMDGVSSLWANLHGHRNPKIDRALQNQIKKVSHSTFLGLTHEPGTLLARDLIAAAPRGLKRVFYSDNGSTAVEVALKMAYQYHAQSSGKGRDRFLALKESYHGDTLGSVSVGGIDLFHKKFRPLLFKTYFANSPHCLRCPHRKKPAPKINFYEYRGENPKPGDLRPDTGCRWDCLADVESILKKNGKKIAAAVVEPVVQGASGILTAPPGYLRGFERLCRKYGVLMIADEVATGFGRTGKLFACEQEGVRPDFMCLAKGISGGYLPLAATLATEKIYRAFLGKYDEFKTFFHGHTYTGNPLATACGRASLKILRSPGFFKKIQKTIAAARFFLKELANFPEVVQIRQAGLMMGIEFKGERAGKKICFGARKNGLLIRPLGDVVVLMPPLSIQANELSLLFGGLKAAVREWRRR